MHRALPRIALAALLVGACAMHDGVLAPSGTLQAGDTWLRTDRPAYSARQEGGVTAIDFELAYTNHLRVPVAVPSCHTPMRPILEKRVDGVWVYAFSPVELMCITPPLVIAPGATYTLRYPLRADRYSLERWPGAAQDGVAGTYRFVWFVATHERGTGGRTPERLPFEYTVSNTFIIE